MLPCLEGEGCELLANRSGWTCTRHGGRRKTTTVRARPRPATECAWGRAADRSALGVVSATHRSQAQASGFWGPAG